MKNFSLTFLHKQQFGSLHKAFEAAFYNYPGSVNTGPEEFKQRLARMGMSYGLSAVAWQNAAVAGFILTATGYFNGKKTAYNAGTGVIPGCRGRGVAKELYHFLFSALAEQQYEACLLEVLTTNHVAIKVYKQLGFTVSRYLHCFTLQEQLLSAPVNKFPLQMGKPPVPDPDLYHTFAETCASWPNSLDCVMRSYPRETVVEAWHKAQTVGFVTFDPQNGRVSQVGVHPGFRRKGIGTQLLRAAQMLSVPKTLTIINVDRKCSSLVGLLQALGFTNPLDQYEMVRQL